MKITKIEKFEDFITVWTDQFENAGFNFKLDDIIDNADLLVKVKIRMDEIKTKENEDTQRITKFETIKNLEGEEIEWQTTK